MTCLLTTPSGRLIVGENWCAEPQEVCPRLPGEDYTKCATVCKQVGHAEIDALGKAGFAAEGATAEIRGHTYACQGCQEALYGAGVISIAIKRAGARG